MLSADQERAEKWSAVEYKQELERRRAREHQASLAVMLWFIGGQY